MTDPEFSKNIITTLANLQSFLRKPMLTMRMKEFFTLSDSECSDIVSSAMSVGCTIPFHTFSSLFKTWLEVSATLPENQRHDIFSRYVFEICKHPDVAINFNYDGLLGVFLSLTKQEQNILSKTFKNVVNTLNESQKKILTQLAPESIFGIIGL